MNIRESPFIPSHFNIQFKLQKFRNLTGNQTHQANNQCLLNLLTFQNSENFGMLHTTALKRNLVLEIREV